jgi:hypothetical protein
MSGLTINNSSEQLNWSHLPGHVQNNRELTVDKEKNTLTFVSDFISAADETTKIQSAKTEPPVSAKGSRPFSYTSENWIG